jgi:hypothetical protein
VGLATGNDIVVIDAILDDPEVGDVIDELTRETVSATLKGMEDRRGTLWRLNRA